jgi:hypothetical protein
MIDLQAATDRDEGQGAPWKEEEEDEKEKGSSKEQLCHAEASKLPQLS